MNDTNTETVIALWSRSTDIVRKIDAGLGAIHGIGFTEYMVLHQLMVANNKTMRRIDLADSIGRTASGVTRMLMPMQKIGLVVKEANARDARVSLVKITEAGEGIYRDASATLAQSSSRELRRLNKAQGDEFLVLLQQLAD